MYKRIWLIAVMLGTLFTQAAIVSPSSAASGSILGLSFCEGAVTTTFTVTGVADDGGNVDWVAVVLAGDTNGDGSVEPIARKEYAIRVGATRTITDTQTFTGSYPAKAVVWLFDLTGPASGYNLDWAALPADVNACTCSTRITFGSVDPAPIDGFVGFFTGFLDNAFLPGAVQQGRLSVTKGERVWGTVVVSCRTHVRAWLFNEIGSVVGYIPSQYEDGDGVFLSRKEDYGTGQGGEPIYVGRFYDLFVVGNAQIDLPPPPEDVTDQGQADTPRSAVVLTDGVLRRTELGGGLVEWGYWTEIDGYTLLGWSKVEAGGTTKYAVPDDGPLTEAQLREFVED
ncbi:MAG: hypothetical protein JXB47_07380 [Anaerolineae bacterium]|nr:hypothetical protein [Anaerolineae bacterium]